MRSDILKSMKQLVNWSEEESHEVNVNYKLYQLLQTSPSILFYQKIINKEYGEAILLANKFGLDKNEVYKAQWNMSNSHISSINVRLLYRAQYFSNHLLTPCLSEILPLITISRSLYENYGSALL